MAGGSRSCASTRGVTSSSPSPHPVLSNVLCLLILLLTTISPIPAVAYGQQYSDGVAAVAGDMIIKTDVDDPSDLSGPPQHMREVRDQEPRDEQEKLPPAEQGAMSRSMQAEGSEGQGDCNYQLSIRTSCSSIPLKPNQQYRIEIEFGDASDKLVRKSTMRTRTKLAPCSVETLTAVGPCLGKVCQVSMSYAGNDEEWIPNYVKVFSGWTMDTFCWPGSSVDGAANVNICQYDRATGSTAAAAAAARTDDEYYSSCGGGSAADADIRT